MKIDEGVCLTFEDGSLLKPLDYVGNSIELSGFSELATHVPLDNVSIHIDNRTLHHTVTVVWNTPVQVLLY